jgi:hypothetical protein
MARPKFDYAEVLYCLFTGRPYIDDEGRRDSFRYVHFVLAEAVIQQDNGIRLLMLHHAHRGLNALTEERAAVREREREANKEAEEREIEERKKRQGELGSPVVLNDVQIRAPAREKDGWAADWLADLRRRASYAKIV